MDPNAFQRLVEKAKTDPEFFHALVFDTENALSKLDFLGRQEKGALLSISPEHILATMVGELTSCGGSYTCSCTSGTCGGVTCGGSTCDVTCSGDSCGNTCGNSCGYTTNLQFARSINRGFLF